MRAFAVGGKGQLPTCYLWASWASHTSVDARSGSSGNRDTKEHHYRYHSDGDRWLKSKQNKKPQAEASKIIYYFPDAQLYINSPVKIDHPRMVEKDKKEE